jgi:polysaccharide deacetylase family protein (PEP-CTERM system associated)
VNNATTPIVNRISFDVEDWFQVENLKSAISRDQWPTMALRVEDSTRKILEILSKADTKATFFILGWVADRCPGLVKEIHALGHEVASHGYGHDLIYDMTPAQYREDAKRAKGLLESLTGAAVTGYRAPSFTIVEETVWALDVLKEEGFLYDSSVFPLTWHDRYGFAKCGPVPFRWDNGLVEIPIAVSQVGKLSLPAGGGGYFRLFPYAYFKTLLNRINKGGDSFTFYLHPWEFDPDQPKMTQVKASHRFRHYVNLRRTAERLTRLLGDFRFEPIDAFAQRWAQANPHTGPAPKLAA